MLSRTASPIRTNVRARAKQLCCFARKRRLCRRFAFFGAAEKKRRARALHYCNGCGVSQSLKKCGGIESRGVSSVQLCERLAVGGFCYPRDFPCLAKRRLNAVRLNSRRAYGFSYSHKCARPRETALLFRAKTAALPPFCFFRLRRKKRRARALHYCNGCGVSQCLKKCGGIESRGVSSVQLCERLAVGGFCYPRDFPHLAKRRLSAVRLNFRRAYGFAVSTTARLRRAHPPITKSAVRTLRFIQPIVIICSILSLF